MSDVEEIKQRCQRCKVNLPIGDFKMKRDRSYQKTCNDCLLKIKEFRNKNKCPHGRRQTICRDCSGGSICEHNRRRSQCIECKGGSVCIHNIRRSTCKTCDPICHLSNVMRVHIRRVITKETDDVNIEKYWHCSVEDYRKYLSDKLTGGMTWENYGKLWNIDHIIPLEYNEPTMAEMIARLHYLNTQPLLIEDNIKKSNKHCDDASDELLSMLSELSIQPEDSASNV